MDELSHCLDACFLFFWFDDIDDEVDSEEDTELYPSSMLNDDSARSVIDVDNRVMGPAAVDTDVADAADDVGSILFCGNNVFCGLEKHPNKPTNGFDDDFFFDLDAACLVLLWVCV